MTFKKWFLSEQENEDKIKHLIDGNNLILFFKKGDEYFGSGEDGRIVFARIKNPDEETPDGWADEASFSALNLNKLAKGEPCQHVIDSNSIKKIKVVDREEVIGKLKGSTEADSKPSGIQIIRFGIATKDRDEAPNFTRTDEE
jgi:hypothetical protein